MKKNTVGGELVQRYGEEGLEDIEFEDLKQGDFFRILDEDGQTVIDSLGNSVFLVVSEPRKDENGCTVLEVEPREGE